MKLVINQSNHTGRTVCRGRVRRLKYGKGSFMQRALFAFLALVFTPLVAFGGELPVLGRIVRKDAKLDSLLPANAKIEVLASGLDWTEGPVWVKDGGYLLFSVIP